MKKLWFEPNTEPPAEPKKIKLKKPEPDVVAVEVPEMKCPCGAEPLFICGAGKRISPNPKLRHDTYEADAVCIKCNAHVGKLFAQMNTLFGLEEDEAVGRIAGVKIY